jgi:hypothetical protein
MIPASLAAISSLADSSSKPPPLWLLPAGMLVALLVPVWTVWDALRSGSIRAGRGLWHRSVNRDDDPIEFWFAICGNCFLFVLLIVAFVSFILNR